MYVFFIFICYFSSFFRPRLCNKFQYMDNGMYFRHFCLGDYIRHFGLRAIVILLFKIQESWCREMGCFKHYFHRPVDTLIRVFLRPILVGFVIVQKSILARSRSDPNTSLLNGTEIGIFFQVRVMVTVWVSLK